MYPSFDLEETPDCHINEFDAPNIALFFVPTASDLFTLLYQTRIRSRQEQTHQLTHTYNKMVQDGITNVMEITTNNDGW